MANTAVLAAATTHRLVYTLTGDGTVAGPTIASATLIADSAAGPLRDLLSASYATQALMRTAMLEGTPARILTSLRVGAATALGPNAAQVAADVDVDAVTATRPEINITMSDTTGQVATLEIEYLHSIIR